MRISAFLLFSSIALPALALAQTAEPPTPAPPPLEDKPVLPGDPVPAPGVPPSVPVLPPVPAPEAPAPVPPVPAPAPPAPPLPDPAKPGDASPVPLPKPDMPDRVKDKGKGRPDDDDKDDRKEKEDRKKPAPRDPASPAPAADTTPPVPAEKMQRPPPRPSKGDVNAPLPAAPVIPTTAPDKKPGVPGPRPAAPSPALPPGTTDPTPVLTADPNGDDPRARPERPIAQKPPSKETTKVLEDHGKRDRKADARQAEKIEDKDDAKRLIMTILGGGAAALGIAPNDRQERQRPGFGDRSRQGYRPPVEEIGRTQQDRERNVGLMVNRFQGRAAPQAAPRGAPPGSLYRDQRGYEISQGRRHTQFYEGNRRVIRYSNLQEIPPVIVASQRLDRVEVLPLSQSAYTARPQGPRDGYYYNEAPPSYTANDAYAVSYRVDPDSAISRDDILFRQGSADFADAYSYDLVIDVAEALNAPALLQETFVIEGHASAEGDYGQNLLLSQERAERISRELVRHGVSPERLMPVGYGETEAAHPATAPESQRSLDRRVMVFRMR